MGEEIKWLWKITPVECFYEPFTTGYRITVVTNQPLQEEQLTLTLRHLFRKVPSLRTCYGERGGERWLREMEQEIIDFEIINEGATEEVLYKLQKYAFNKMTGPLWCVKLKPVESPSEDSLYTYDVFVGINHVITDGTSNVRICGFLVRILDDVISGRPVDDAEQLGVFVSGEKTQALLEEQVALVEADPQLRLRVQEEYQALQSRKSIFKRTFRKPGVKEVTSVMITRDLDYDITCSLIKRCRAEGVTFNSACVGLANIAMVDVLVERGLVQDSYDIRSDHVLDSRRYWDEGASQGLGLHILLPISVLIETKRNARENLWSYIKSVHEEMIKKTKTKKPLQEQAAMRSIPNAFTLEYDYSVTNVGDVTKHLADGLQNVRVTHMLRGSIVHNMPIPFCLNIHTLSGRLTLSLVYNTSIVEKRIAQMFSDTIFDNLKMSVQK